ncbi:MAG TPA: HAMP domain-containing sensor histidine kinase [Thermoanaerobaculia bacterium]|nr:HAMP domain-containing sensor histidine kinase [Thermoanaerobaculia bacterium]
MISTFLARLQATSRPGSRSTRVSILLPFLIISAGLGVLAYRSHQLSVRMERGLDTLAVQYVGYAAEITALRVDAAVAAELARVTDEWQQTERRLQAPTPGALQTWVNQNEWIVSAIYVPDSDPTNSIYVSEIPSSSSATSTLTREFYTSSGTVRYGYDPDRLLQRVRSAIRQQPLVRSESVPGTLEIQKESEIALVAQPKERDLVRTTDGFAFVSPLAAPLGTFAIRASVRMASVSPGWENLRLMSLLVNLVAFILTALGAYLALLGLQREADAMKLRGALIANVSHELRTPLSMIRLGAETLKRGPRLKEKDRQEIEDSILREVLHLSHLVENVLDVARIQHRSTKALAFGPVYPRELVTSLVTTYESWIRSKGFKIDVDLADGVDEQFWDRDAVSRALLNLIDNAIKYSGDKKALEIILRQTDEHVIIEVKDHGIGIEAKDLAKIFDPYYRAQFSDTQTRRGAGLGLTLVQQITQSHGGRIEVDSTPGVGSTFRLLFPRGKGEAAAPIPSLVQSPEAF